MEEISKANPDANSCEGEQSLTKAQFAKQFKAAKYLQDHILVYSIQFVFVRNFNVRNFNLNLECISSNFR